jgi:YihY family inner membrane protein
MTTMTPDRALHVSSTSTRRVGRFTADVIRRFRHADGTSHARALAFQVMLVVLSGFVGVVGVASLLDMREVRSVVQHLVAVASPGPSGALLQEAAQQGAHGGALAAIIGIGGALVAGTFAVAQVERSANRVMGLDRDRPTGRRYVVAFLLTVPVGALLTIGGLAIGAGSAIVDGLGLEGSNTLVWEIARWPLGLVFVGAGLMVLLRAAPSRRLGSTRHLLIGTAVSLALWALFTVLLSVYFAISSSASSVYGPLLSVIALLLWALMTSLALHLGITASLELER